MEFEDLKSSDTFILCIAQFSQLWTGGSLFLAHVVWFIF